MFGADHDSTSLRWWLWWFRRLVWLDVWTDESDDGGLGRWVAGRFAVEFGCFVGGVNCICSIQHPTCEELSRNLLRSGMMVMDLTIEMEQGGCEKWFSNIFHGDLEDTSAMQCVTFYNLAI